MELLQLRYFLTVAKTLNISRAAKHHMIPQPAMSQTISRLEKELGTPLFHRYKNRLSLTQEGQAFLDGISESIAALDSAVQNVHCDDLPLRGEITLLVRQHRGTMVDCIVAFRKEHPDVSFRIFHMQGENDAQDYDMCISSTPPSESYRRGQCLITERLKLMVSASHPMAMEKAVGFESLKDADFALLDSSNSLWHHTMHLCRQSGFQPKISMICGDLHCMVKYIGTGMAVTLGPEVSWRGIQNDSVVFLPTVPEERRSTYVFWNEKRPLSKLHQTFLDFLVAYFAGQAVDFPA